MGATINAVNGLQALFLPNPTGPQKRNVYPTRKTANAYFDFFSSDGDFLAFSAASSLTATIPYENRIMLAATTATRAEYVALPGRIQTIVRRDINWEHLPLKT